MRKLILFVAVMMVGSGAFAQIVPSSCTAPDSIIKKYKEDADRLAVRKFYRRNYLEKDTVLIPKAHSDTVLNALLAVYNATSIPARDTVTGIYKVHTSRNLTLNQIELGADSSQPWMHQLKLGIIPTGTAPIDSFLFHYHFDTVVHYYPNFINKDVVLLGTDSNYNIKPLIPIANTLQGVIQAYEAPLFGDGNDITDSIFSDHIELVYSVGWGDCPAGCTFRRYWKFNVYYDCSVSFVGSWGNILSSFKEIQTSPITISPNPTTSIITIKGITQPTVVIYNLMGQKVVATQVSNEVSLAQLPAGMYLVQVFNKDMQLVKSEKVILNR